ncbi:GNAT family N-acetyltransferase [Streptomyces brasiliensis]|uniref:N-acetyltransferase n=1 Tax=Streptomyces brasiliensis TaxID=1954 RepID=A0A917NVA3_9ACTN|nr:GNAT family N-acetyltransferase [Streptomyces brasiliensis]GGJ32105.1 N-acetyltransferase [Streptomyces brasiliensis]
MSIDHTWYLTEDLDDFLSRAGGFLRSRPALHTVPLTVTEALRTRGLYVYGPQAPLFGVLEDGDTGKVRATLLQTPPYPLGVTALTAREAEALATHLHVLGHPLSGVSAVRDTAEAFAGAWERLTGEPVNVHQQQRLYRLGGLTTPEPAPEGRARLAEDRDRGLLVRWIEEFCTAVGQPGLLSPTEWTDARLAHDGVTLWETSDGTPTAMASLTPSVGGQVRVAAVYTPAGLRGRGYAGAVTAEVSRRARNAGTDEVLLFTDLANPTSNGLYQRIGYRGVADFTMYDFGGGGS